MDVGTRVIWAVGDSYACYGVVVEAPPEWLEAGQVAVHLDHQGEGEAIGCYARDLVVV